MIASATGSCRGWKITTTRGLPASPRSIRPATVRATAAPAAASRGEARPRPVRHAPRPDRHHAVGAQQVLGLVAQDEAVERAWEQQQAERVGGHPVADPSGRPPVASAPRGKPAQAPAGVVDRLPGALDPVGGARAVHAPALHAVADDGRVRLRRDAAHVRDPELDPVARGDRRGVRALLLRRRGPRAARPARPHHRDRRAGHHERRGARRTGAGRPDQRAAARACATRPCWPAGCSGCGRSPTWRSPTRCCASTSAGAPSSRPRSPTSCSP